MDAMNLKVTANRKIMKYAEGATPGVDEPYEVTEQEVELTGQDALDALAKMGISRGDALLIAQQQQQKSEE